MPEVPPCTRSVSPAARRPRSKTLPHTVKKVSGGGDLDQDFIRLRLGLRALDGFQHLGPARFRYLDGAHGALLSPTEEAGKMKSVLITAIAAAFCTQALADFNDKKPINATVTGAT